jgi:hypothetical protein
MKNSLIYTSVVGGLLSVGSALAANPLSNFNASVGAYVGTGPATTTIYSVNGGANFMYSSANEFGDQVTVSGGAGQVISSLSFEYYANYAQSGGLSLKVYANDGVGGAPGTQLDSRSVDIKQGGANLSLNFSYDAANILPTTFTYAVQFAGHGGANVAGLITGNAVPSVGSSLNDFWEKRGGAWVKNQVVIPEPTTVALFSVAGLAFVGAMVGRRHRN